MNRVAVTEGCAGVDENEQVDENQGYIQPVFTNVHLFKIKWYTLIFKTFRTDKFPSGLTLSLHQMTVGLPPPP